MEFPFRTSTPSQSEIFSLKAVIVACSLCSYTVAFQDPAHPPKEKYSLSQLLLWLALSARIQWPSRTSTPSQREIFSLTAVIVACSLCSYTVALQDQHTLPKRNILSHSCYCGLLSLLVFLAFQDQHTLPKRNILSHSCYCGLLSLLVYSGLPGPAHPPKEKYSLKAVIVACSYGVSFQDQHTLPKRNILSKLLLWLVLCICISGLAHPPKVKYSLSQLLL